MRYRDPTAEHGVARSGCRRYRPASLDALARALRRAEQVNDHATAACAWRLLRQEAR